MALQSIRNHRGFFSDYWLGTLQSARGGGVRITPAQSRKLLDRLTRLADSVPGIEEPDLTRFRERFARPLLMELLEFDLLENAPEPRLRPLVVMNGEARTPVAMAMLCPGTADADSRQNQRKLDDELITRQMDYGIVVSPEMLRLVRRSGLGTRGAAFDLSLASVVENQDNDSLAAACRVLAALNFVPDPAGKRPIDLLEEESRRHSARVSEDLKQAVFKAAEHIVGGFLDDVRSRSDAFAPAPSIEALRDAGFLALYRLLFILYAEARDERLALHRLYRDSYSLDAMVTRLLSRPAETLAANSFGLWAQLRAVFRIFNEGIANLPQLENIPPRGGRLFSEETPEGRLLRTLRLDDRCTAAILLALATTQPRRGVGRERVSFRELEIEQLGAVYEGLLEYEAAEATATFIECRAGGRDLVLPPAELVRLADQKALVASGDFAIVAGTEAEGLHPDAVSGEDDEADEDEDAADAMEADDNDADKGVKRGATLKLLRRLPRGSFYFKPGAARKATGSFYTPTPIVNYLVRESLGPLVEGKTAAEIEGLRIIDLACGSAHFLVGAARFLAPKLLEAYRREGDGRPPAAFHPDRPLSAEVRARWVTEGPDWCRRRIIEHCLFGVDLNPAAVQLAQVSLWIESLAGDRPLSFFAHHIRNGNALLGSSLARFDRPPHPRLETAPGQFSLGLFETELKQRLARALDERRLIDAPVPPEVRADTPEEYAYKEDRLRRAEQATIEARLLLDLRSAAGFLSAIWHELPILMSSTNLEEDSRARPWWQAFDKIRDRERFFHWELEFPEVFAAGGFDCVLGNPPWEKVKPDRKEFYGGVDVLIRAYTGGELDARIRELHSEHPELQTQFEEYSERVKTLAQCLKGGGDYEHVDWEIDGRSTGGDPDLFKFFVERSHSVLKKNGRLGYLVPSAVYNNEGCTGLRHLLLNEMQIERFHGFENRKKIFDIDSRIKFVCLVAEKSMKQASDYEFKAAYKRHDLDELVSGPPPDVEVPVTLGEVMAVSPGTLTFLEYLSQQDRQLLLKIHDVGAAETQRIVLGDQGQGTWNARFHGELHLTNDRELWTDPRSNKLWTVRQILGTDPGNFQEARDRMAEKGFWPLYQDGHIHQYVLEFKPIWRWVRLDAHERKYGKRPDPSRKVVIRDRAQSTDERTCIAALLPENSCFGHTLNGIHVDETLKLPLLGVLNSLSFDYVVRKRVGGQHVSPYLLMRAAIPPPGALATIRNVPCLHANESKTWIYDHPEFYDLLWAIEKSVAMAFGLVDEEFRILLDDFPGFARKRLAFHEFLLSRLAEN